MSANLGFALDGAWKVLYIGLLLGAGLPLVFALGIRSLAIGGGSSTAPSATGKAAATVCFLVVAVAVAIGITVIVAAGFGKVVSFEHVYPTLVPKP